MNRRNKYSPLNPATTFFGVFIFIVLFVLGFGTDNLKFLIDLPSVQIVFGTFFSVLLISGKFAKFFILFPNIILCGFDTHENRKTAIEICNLAAISFFLSGMLGTAIGLILLSLAEDAHSNLLINIATSLVTFLYGVFFAILFYAFKIRIILNSSPESDKQSENEIIRKD